MKKPMPNGINLGGTEICNRKNIFWMTIPYLVCKNF